MPIIARMTSSPQQQDSGRPGEFELIAALKRVIDDSPPASEVIVGIGDDAAAVSVESGIHVMTTDTMVDGVHFLRERASWSDVGWKSAVSNLSDIAAMGAAPLHTLVTIGVPADVAVTDMEEMYRGLTGAFAEFGGGIVGGDVVSSSVFFVTVALTGRAAEEDGSPVVLRRDAAEAGDLIAVTGTIGGSVGGLSAVLDGLEGADAEALKQAHYRPVPRIAEGQMLVENGVHCAMDVSDGLVADLEKICAASEVGAVIKASDVPVPEELTSQFGEEALPMALSGGEDYELLFTLPFDLMDRLFARHRGMFTHIGHITDEPDEGDRVVMVDSDGVEMDLQSRGWDHLGAR